MMTTGPWLKIHDFGGSPPSPRGYYNLNDLPSLSAQEGGDGSFYLACWGAFGSSSQWIYFEPAYTTQAAAQTALDSFVQQFGVVAP